MSTRKSTRDQFGNRVLWSAITLSILASSVYAQAASDPQFGAYAEVGNTTAGANGIAQQSSLDGAPTSSTVTGAPAQGVSASARAGEIFPGLDYKGPSLGAYAQTNSLNVQSGEIAGSQGWYARAGSGIRIYDGVIGGTGNFITTSFSFYLDGDLYAQVFSNPSGFRNVNLNVYSNISVALSVTGTSVPSLINSYRQVAAGGMGIANVVDSRDGFGFLLDNATWTSSFGHDSISGIVTINGVVLPVNQEFELDVNLTAFTSTIVSAGAGLDATTMSTYGVATSDFFDTLGFQADFPILGLPSGYTFNAASVGIANNLCSGATCVATAAVPEPQSYAMLLAGIGLLGLMVKRKT